MRSKMRRWLLLLAVPAVIAVPVVAVTGESSAGATGVVHIALFGFNNTPYALAAESAANAAAKKYGAAVTFFNGNSDPPTQLAQVQTALASGQYQAFDFQALDGHGLQPLAVQAHAKGIKTAAVEYSLAGVNAEVSLHAEPGVDTTLGVGSGVESNYVVSEIEKACAAKVGKGKPCNVALQPGLLNFPPDAWRIPYFTKALTATGYIKVAVMPAGMYFAQAAQTSTVNFFQTNPKVDVIYTFADQMIDGVLTGLKQVNRTPGKDVYVVALGASKQAEQLIKSGQVFASVGLYPATEQTLAVKYLVALVHGQSVPKTVNMYALPGDLPYIDKAALKAHPSFKPNWSYK